MKKIKPKSYDHGLAPSKAARNKKVYPTIRIDLEHLPEAKKWKVGSKYGLDMVVKMVGLSQSRYQNEAEFEIRALDTSESPEDEGDEEDESEEKAESASDENEE